MAQQTKDDQLLPWCNFCASAVALLRKRRILSEKGRKESSRVWAQWRNTKQKKDTWDVFAEAITYARRTPAGLESFQVIGERLLYLLFLELTKTPGAKRRPAGLLYAKRENGRPLTIPLEEEKCWMQFANGVKLGLWARAEGFKTGSYEKALAALGSDDELNESVTDREAIEYMAKLSRNPPSKSIKSLMRRLSAARKTYSATLKSGG
ncbi:MAG TPA: hypothetical protein VMV91_14810 [Rhodocyclaceae bacterium]|nr:hypothetical protein [Rhodocyclaceae bacterium]